MKSSLIQRQRNQFHQNLLSGVLHVDDKGIPTNADKDSKQSVRIALSLAKQLAASSGRTRLKGQTSGQLFESAVEEFLFETFGKLSHLRPGLWQVTKVSSRSKAASIAKFEQYGHLIELAKLASDNPSLAVALGSDYLIAPDVVIYRNPEPEERINAGDTYVDQGVATLTPLRKENGGLPILHASVSCKWTIRSDRSQNAKAEALNMVRNRKGPMPHVVAVTGEPLPSRIASLALGTGDLDTVYHFALPELIIAVGELKDETGKDLLKMMVDGKRLRDISDLPLDLSI